jgi:hypothetical protein
VALDNGAADREAHSQATRLGRMEGREDFIQVPGLEPGPGVPHRDQHARLLLDLRPNDQLTAGGRKGGSRLYKHKFAPREHPAKELGE